MKKLKIWNLIAILAIALLGHSCSEGDDQVIFNEITIKLQYPNGFEAKEGVNVKARGVSGLEFKVKTDKKGKAIFNLPIGTYEFSTSDIRTVNKKFTALNGFLNKTIGENWKKEELLIIEMQGSTRSQLILKEVYFGGCPRDNSNSFYPFDAYITLYNNSSEPVNLQNLCFGMTWSNSDYMKREIDKGETVPRWFKKDWTPASIGYFYFPNPTSLKPYSSLVIAANGAIDHTKVHSQSVDLSSSTNYVMYDVDKFNQPYYYKAPSANIPASQYLKASKYGLGKAWTVPFSSPNVFLFYPKGQTPDAYGNDKENIYFGKKSVKFPWKKVPASWVVDAIDAFAAGKESKNVKRINPKVDAGHVYFVSKKGYTLYRNVDKDLTEAIEGNKEKLVYNYAMGTRDIEPKYGSSDPSEIDAEASIANGATIIYKDTNNSGSDFHMRKQSTLKK